MIGFAELKVPRSLLRGESIDGHQDAFVFKILCEVKNLFHLLKGEHSWKPRFFPWPADSDVLFSTAKYLLVIEFDSIDPLVLLTYRNLFVLDQFKYIVIYLLTGDGIQILSSVITLEIEEVVCIGGNCALTVSFSPQQLKISGRKLYGYGIHHGPGQVSDTPLFYVIYFFRYSLIW